MKIRKILVPLDSSPISTRTITHLIAQKENIPFSLTLLHVLDLGLLSTSGFPETTFPQFEKRARSDADVFIKEQKRKFEAASIQVETLLKEGVARNIICQTADSGDYDLLVVGRNTEGELRKLLFGQVANYIIHHVKCPVLIV